MPHIALPSGASIYYEGSGTGDPVVLVPGWTLNHHLWDLVQQGLERFHKIVAMDPRGAGLSSQDPNLEYSPASDVEDLEGLMDALDVPAAHLVGHSKGARTVLSFAMLHPERAQSVCAIGSGEPHPPDGDGSTPRERIYSWVRHLRDRARAEGPQTALESMREANPIGPARLDAERFRAFKRATRGYSGVDLASDVPRRRIDTDSLAHRLTMPVLYLCGDSDPFLAECRYAHQRVCGAALEVIPRCGHYPPLEAPEVTARALLDFIGRAPAQGG
jgi:pimeloyl-ACP methyl ester carboxylesterase